MAVLLDTHIWLWLATGDGKLSQKTRREIEKAAQDGILISAISVWELAMLVHTGRFLPNRSPRAWVTESLDRLGMEVLSLTPDIALESYVLPGDFHKDPADRMIMATSRLAGVPLITYDKAILAYARKHHIAVIK